VPPQSTNKQQSITIQSSSGLSDSDIDKMVREAEQYAEKDKVSTAQHITSQHSTSQHHSTSRHHT
jgi:molecular chaperone DnaK